MERAHASTHAHVLSLSHSLSLSRSLALSYNAHWFSQLTRRVGQFLELV
jgi:hypothetical protein